MQSASTYSHFRTCSPTLIITTLPLIIMTSKILEPKMLAWYRALSLLSALLLMPSLLFSQKDDLLKAIDKTETQLAATVEDDSNKIKLLIKLYDYNFRTSYNPEKGIEYVKQAVQTARKFGNPRWLVKALQHYASSFDSKGDYLSQVTILTEASELCKANNLTDLENIVISDLGAVYLDMGSFQKALTYFTKAKQMVENFDDFSHIAILTLNIAIIQKELGHYKEALSDLKKVLLNIKKIKSKPDIISHLYTVAGSTCAELGNNELALAYFDSAQIYINNLGGDVRAETRLKLTLGKFYLNKLHEPLKTISLLEQYIKGLGVSLVYELYEAKIILAKSYIALNDPRKAIELLNSNLPFIKEADVPIADIRPTYSLMSKAKIMLGDWNGASEASSIANELADSLIADENRKHAVYSVIAHEIESNEKDLIKKNIELSSQKKILTYVFIAAIIIIIISLIAIYYRVKLKLSREKAFMNQKNSEVLKKEVEERTKELEKAHEEIQATKERENMSLAILNQKHLDLLDSMSKKLYAWQESGDVMAPKSLNTILNELKDAQRKAEEWGGFMLYFEKIHPEFNSKILKICPSLNNNELKHCAYMKLGMSRKQVAEIVYSSEGAVKLYRNRIRKKIGLDPDDSLQKFINAL